jgi:hypothetical protein
MSIIRRVSIPVAGTVQLIPPDGKHRDGQYQWTVINPTGSGGQVELVDDAGKTIGAGLPLAAGATPWQTLGRDETVYAAGPASGSAVSVIVTGTIYGD